MDKTKFLNATQLLQVLNSVISRNNFPVTITHEVPENSLVIWTTEDNIKYATTIIKNFTQNGAVSFINKNVLYTSDVKLVNKVEVIDFDLDLSVSELLSVDEETISNSPEAEIRAIVKGTTRTYSHKYQDEILDVLAQKIIEKGTDPKDVDAEHIYMVFLRLFQETEIVFGQIKVIYNELKDKHGNLGVDYNTVYMDVQGALLYDVRILYLIDKERAAKELEKLILSFCNIPEKPSVDTLISLKGNVKQLLYTGTVNIAEIVLEDDGVSNFKSVFVQIDNVLSGNLAVDNDVKVKGFVITESRFYELSERAERAIKSVESEEMEDGDALPDDVVVRRAAAKGVASDIRTRKKQAVMNIITTNPKEYPLPKSIIEELVGRLYHNSYELQDETPVKDIDADLVKEIYDRYIRELDINVLDIVIAQFEKLLADNEADVTKDEQKIRKVKGILINDLSKTSVYRPLKVIASLSSSELHSAVDNLVAEYLPRLIDKGEKTGSKSKLLTREEGIQYLADKGIDKAGAERVIDVLLEKEPKTWIPTLAKFTAQEIQAKKVLAFVNAGISDRTKESAELRNICNTYLADNFSGKENAVKLVKFYSLLASQGISIEEGLTDIFKELKDKNVTKNSITVDTDIITTESPEYVDNISDIINLYADLESNNYPKKTLKELEEQILVNYKKGLYSAIDAKSPVIIDEYRRLFL